MPQQTVTGPDGKPYQFPSDATDAEILSFFQKQQPTIPQPHTSGTPDRPSVMSGTPPVTPTNQPTAGSAPNTTGEAIDRLKAAPGNFIRGLYSLATTNPLTTLANEGHRISGRLGKAWDAAKSGDLPEAAGQTLAAIPVLGEMGAQPAEEARSGHPVAGFTDLGINLASLAGPEVAGAALSKIPLKPIGNRLVASAANTTTERAAQMTERGAGVLNKSNSRKLYADPEAQPTSAPVFKTSDSAVNSEYSDFTPSELDAIAKTPVRVEGPGTEIPGPLRPVANAHYAATMNSGGLRGMVTDAVKGGVAGELLSHVPFGGTIRRVLSPIAAVTHPYSQSAIGQGLVSLAGSDIPEAMIRNAILASLAGSQTQPMR